MCFILKYSLTCENLINAVSVFKLFLLGHKNAKIPNKY